MSNLTLRREAHRARQEAQRQRKRQRRANRTALEAKGIDTSPAQHDKTPEQLERQREIRKDVLRAELTGLSKDDVRKRTKKLGIKTNSKTTKKQMIDAILERVAA